jgi:hypothetical protein
VACPAAHRVESRRARTIGPPSGGKVVPTAARRPAERQSGWRECVTKTAELVKTARIFQSFQRSVIGAAVNEGALNRAQSLESSRRRGTAATERSEQTIAKWRPSGSCLLSSHTSSWTRAPPAVPPAWTLECDFSPPQRSDRRNRSSNSTTRFDRRRHRHFRPTTPTTLFDRIRPVRRVPSLAVSSVAPRTRSRLSDR